MTGRMQNPDSDLGTDFKKVLWVSYLYPPLFCGVGRQVKVAKYLPMYGWRPIVLTVKRSILHPFKDESRMKDIPPEAEVHRTRTLETRLTYLPVILRLNPKWVRIPDQFVGWYPFAVRQALRIIKEERVDAIFTTSMPNTSHLIGLTLKRRTGLPWVADFRDPWVRNTQITCPRPIRAIESKMEAAVIQHADRITAIDEPITQDFREAYPDQSAEKFIGIPHGFDPEDFADIPGRERSSSDKFTLTFTGSLYGRGQGVSFAYAVRDLMDTDKELAQRLQVRLVGNVSKLKRLSDSLDLGSVMSFTGLVTHEEAWSLLADSDVALFLLGNREVDEKVPCGKLAEYLARSKPTLAVVPEGGLAANIIRQANIGVVVDPEDRAGILEAIRNLYGKWRSGDLHVYPNREFIDRYDIRRIAGRFAAIFDELVGGRK